MFNRNLRLDAAEIPDTVDLLKSEELEPDHFSIPQLSPKFDLEICRAIKEILDNYHCGYRRITGEKNWSLDSEDRRISGREPVVLPFYLTPLENEWGNTGGNHAASIMAVTRDLSSRGIGFRTDVSISSDLLLAEFDTPRQGSIRFLLEVRWKRKETAHSFLVGAQIMRLVRPGEFAQ